MFDHRSNRAGVNEEEVFASVTGKLINDEYGAQVFDRYQTAFQLNRSLEQGSPEPSAEKAANRALRFLQQSGDLSEEELTALKNVSFQVSQLDNNRSALYDSVGGPGDGTRAVKPLLEASRLVSGRLAQLPDLLQSRGKSIKA